MGYYSQKTNHYIQVLIDLNNITKQRYESKIRTKTASPIYAAIGIKTVNLATF
jgi:hypothetical protein